MSLGRLLAAGKSLVGVRDAASRFRMDKHASLPKFISPKNPFASPNEDVPGKTPASTPSRRLSPAEIAAAGLKQTQKLPATATARSAEGSGSGSWIGTQLRANAGEWARKWNPLQLGARNQTVSKAGPVRLNRVPVQGELSLDRVKVVRNDLSDADLEVVVVKPKADVPAAESGWPGIQTQAASDRAWSRLAARFFGADAA